jgi:hypothetical protein
MRKQFLKLFFHETNPDFILHDDYRSPLNSLRTSGLRNMRTKLIEKLMRRSSSQNKLKGQYPEIRINTAPIMKKTKKDFETSL